MGIDKVIGAARVLHSENVSELMEAMAEDARDARARRETMERNHAPTIRDQADKVPSEDSTYVLNEQGDVPRRTAA